MSVILTACRNSKQRAVERALKKRAEKLRLKQESRMRKEAELLQLEQSMESDIIKAWSFAMNSQPCNVVLCLPTGKDSVDIYCNEQEVQDVITNVSPEGATFDFVISCTYKARISSFGNPAEGLVHTLTIDGYLVPE